MRKTWLLLAFVLFLVLPATSLLLPTTAQETKEKPKDKIIPLVTLKPGETKDLLLSSTCARVTRGRGLLLRDMKASYLDAEKTWSGNGLDVSFVDSEDEKEPASLTKVGLKSFMVRVAAAKDAKSGLTNLHIADETCSGTCDTDLRIVVVEQ